MAKANVKLRTAAELTTVKTPDVTGDIVNQLRQLQPEQQNEILKEVLREIALDRHNRLSEARIEASRAENNLNTLVMYATGFEKIMCEAVDKLQDKRK